MADCGATASFIDSLFAQLHGLKFSPLQHPQDLTVADGRFVFSRAITHTVTAQISFALRAHTKVFKLFITTLDQYPVVLGLPWLQKHNACICFSENTVTFDSKRCLDHCIATHQAMTICGADNTFDTLHELETPQETHKIHESHKSHKTSQETHRSAATAMPRSNTVTVAKRCLDPTVIDTAHEIHETQETRHSTSTPKPQYDPRSSHHIDMADCTRKMNQELTMLNNSIVTKHTTCEARNLTKDITSAARKTMNISMIGAALFNHLVQKSHKDLRCQIFSVTLQDINIALAPKKHTNPATKLPSEYHDFLDVFSSTEADVLPKHWPRYDHTIELMEDKVPTWGLLYSMSANELKVLKAYIEKMVDKGFIRASFLSAASPVLFAKKPGGGLRFCVDYQILNAITVKNRYPLPLVKETLERVCKAKIFSKINIIAAFNKLQIKEEEEWKTAFQTWYGLYKYLVMPFGLANGPSSFQNYINDVLHSILDVFCTAYINNILIYSNTKK